MTVYFNLYLTAISLEDKEKAKEYNLKCLEYNIKLNDGKDTDFKSSNCYFIQS